MTVSMIITKRVSVAAGGGHLARDDVDHDGGRIGQYVIDGGTTPGLLHEPTQRLVVSVSFNMERNPDLLVAIADRTVGESEKSEQVDVALHSGRDLVQIDPARGRNVGNAGREAGSNGMEHELDRRRRMILANQNRRMVGVKRGDVFVLHFLHSAVEVRQL